MTLLNCDSVIIGACRPGPTRVDNAPGVVGFIKIRFHCCKKSNKVSIEGSFACLAWAHNFFYRRL